MKHPAGVQDAKLWFGREVEGEMSRYPRAPMTAFVAGELDDAQVARVLSEAQHLFLVETFSAWVWFERTFIPRYPYPITVGRVGDAYAIREVLALPFAGRLRIIARVFDAPWIELLRDEDELSVGVPYRLRTFLVRDGVQTMPSDYVQDFT